MKTQRRKGTMKMAAEGAQKLLEVPFIIIVRYAINLKLCLSSLRFARISVELKASFIQLLYYGKVRI
jgi:hypothetical protein